MNYYYTVGRWYQQSFFHTITKKIHGFHRTIFFFTDDQTQEKPQPTHDNVVMWWVPLKSKIKFNSATTWNGDGMGAMDHTDIIQILTREEG